LKAAGWCFGRNKKGEVMVMKLHTTLYDAIRDKAGFERLVHDAVAHSLAQLGERIYDLEWANMRAKASVVRMVA
jgi:hypothetical protein